MSKINLGQDMSTLEVGLKQAAYTGVLLHAGQDDIGNDIDYFAGSQGNVLEITVPNGTKQMAQTVLDGLKKRGYRYQPFTADRTVADPSIEIGDSVTANGTSAVVMGYDIKHSRLMAPALKAPFDEEVDHEFKYVPRSEREYKRESAYTRSRLSINANAIVAEVARASQNEGRLSSRLTIAADAITAEVERASSAEGSLRTSIEQNATAITAKVSKSGGSSSSFAWSLTDNAWDLISNNTTVLHATSSGIEVKGTITATSGYIGTESAGFEIGSSYIRNGKTSLTDDEHDGVFIGTNGISLGKGKFRVNSNGYLTASDLHITGGHISIGDDGEGNPMFLVTDQGVVSARNLNLIGGQIIIRDGDGNVAFRVSPTGDLTATTGTFSGNVYAKNIQFGGSAGTMSGGGITAGSIGTGTGSPLSSAALGGIGGGANFSSMETQAYYADWLCCYNFVCSGGAISGKHYGSWSDDSQTHSASWQSYTYPTGVSVWTQNNSYEYVYNTDGISKAVLSGIGLYGSLTTGSGKLNYVGR